LPEIESVSQLEILPDVHTTEFSAIQHDLLESNPENGSALSTKIQKCSCAACESFVIPPNCISNGSTDPKYNLSDIFGDMDQRMYHNLMQDKRLLLENRSLHDQYNKLSDQVHTSHEDYKRYKRSIFILANEGVINAKPEEELSIEGIGSKLTPKVYLLPLDSKDPNYESRWTSFALR
jgi:hypothetical protein